MTKETCKDILNELRDSTAKMLKDLPEADSQMQAAAITSAVSEKFLSLQDRISAAIERYLRHQDD